MDGGSVTRYRGIVRWLAGGLAAFGLVASVVVCHLLAQGSFYWLSDSIAAPRSLAGWWKNYSDWLLPYLGTAALYVGIAAVLQVMGTLLARHLPAASASASR